MVIFFVLIQTFKLKLEHFSVKPSLKSGLAGKDL